VSAFDYAVQHTLAAEGVFSDDKNDRGGRTKYGISTPTLATYQRKFQRLVDRDVATLTKSEAIEIYRAMFWRYDGLISRMIATELFDIGVNRGLTTAVLIMQRAINFHPSSLAVTEDGLWGPGTLAAINTLCVGNESRLLLFKAMVYFQARSYVAIVENNPSQLDFFDGWITRAAERPRD
jgi:lysozyme family protein